MSIEALFESAHGAMASAGADFFGAYTGSYTAPGGGSPTAVRVLLTRGVQIVGDYGETSTKQDVADLDLSQITPAHGATLVIDGTTYKLDAEQSNDGVSAAWSLRRG